MIRNATRPASHGGIARRLGLLYIPCVNGTRPTPLRDYGGAGGSA